MNDTLKKKQQRIKELGALISIHGERITHATKAKIQELQDRLTFRLEEWEEKGMDMKIEIMEEVLTLLQKDKKNETSNN